MFPLNPELQTLPYKRYLVKNTVSEAETWTGYTLL